MEQSFFIVCAMRGMGGIAAIGPFVGPGHEGYDRAESFIAANRERMGDMPIWIQEVSEPAQWLEENCAPVN